MNLHLIGGGNKEPIIAAAVKRVERPNALIIPSSSASEATYSRRVPKIVELFNRLDVPNTVLHGRAQKPTETEMAEKFGNSSLLYVVGGHAPTLMRALREHGSDTYILEAIKQRKVYIGTSAGALAVFKEAFIKPVGRQMEVETWDYEFLQMLAVLEAAATVHANVIDDPRKKALGTRLDHFVRRFPADVNIGFGIDNDAALVIENGSSRVARSSQSATVHLVRRSKEAIDAIAIQDNEELAEAVNSII